MGIEEIEEYFTIIIMDDVNDYIRDNEYDLDFDNYMKKMSNRLCNKTDLEIYDKNPELFDAITKYELRNVYENCYYKYIDDWVEVNIIHTANYLKNSK